jgi:hypothetical protein
MGAGVKQNSDILASLKLLIQALSKAKKNNNTLLRVITRKTRTKTEDKILPSREMWQ